MRPLVAVVDDDESVRESLPDLLREFGFAVEAFESAEDFLSSPHVDQVRCLIVDIAMPGMSGFEVAQGIRATPWGRDIVLVALTGWGQEEDRRRTAEAGFDHHLTKPVPPDAIEELIRQT